MKNKKDEAKLYDFEVGEESVGPGQSHVVIHEVHVHQVSAETQFAQRREILPREQIVDGTCELDSQFSLEKFR